MGPCASGRSPFLTSGIFATAATASYARQSHSPSYICRALRGCTVRNLSGYALNKGISDRSSSLRSTPILAFTEKRPSPIVSQPTASIFSRTSGVRRSPLPRPLLRTIGYGQPQLRSAVESRGLHALEADAQRGRVLADELRRHAD